MDTNYFLTTSDSPYHFSVGAVLFNEVGKIYCNYYTKSGFRENFHTLMRESIKPNETIEECLARGLLTEFGAKGEIVRMLGSIVANDEWFGETNRNTMVEKTTLYFLVKLTEINSEKREKIEDQVLSEVKALTVDEFIKTQKDQFERMRSNDLDESMIVQRARLYI